MAIALVGGTQKAGTLAVASGDLTVNFPANTTAGNLLTVVVASDSNASNTYTVTDQAGGNAFASAVGVAYDATYRFQTAIYYLANCPGGITGVKCHSSDATAQFTAGIAEFSGAATASPLDGASATNSSTGTSTAATSNNCTPVVDGDLIWGGGPNGGYTDTTSTTDTAGTSPAFSVAYNSGTTTNGVQTIAEYLIQGAHAAVAAAFTLSRSTKWQSAVAAFKAAGAAAGGPPNRAYTVLQSVPNAAGF